MTTATKSPASAGHRQREDTAAAGPARDDSPLVMGTSDCHRAMMAFEREGRPITPRLRADMLRLADRILALGHRYLNAAHGIRETIDLSDAEIDRHPPIAARDTS